MAKEKSKVQVHREFKEANQNFVETVTTNDEGDQTQTVVRVVEGQLAVDVRKRVMAAEDAEVTVEEVVEEGWLSDVTSELDYRLTVRCNGVEKKFSTYSASENFARLLRWLDENPS